MLDLSLELFQQFFLVVPTAQTQKLQPTESLTYDMCVRVCVCQCVRVCASACVRVCVSKEWVMCDFGTKACLN